MNSLKILPNIKRLLKNNKEDEAISIINTNIDSLSLYLEDSLHLFSAQTKESALCLSKIYFVLQDYDKSSEYAIKAGDLFLNDKTFYFKAIIDRMMNSLLNDRSHFCRNFIMDLIKQDRSEDICINDSLIGYLYSINEYELFEVFFSKKLSNKDILNYIYKIVQENDDLDRFYSSIIKIYNTDTEDTLYILIDALVHFNKINDIENLIIKIENKDICQCYTICFYIQECYNLKISLENPNLNLILSGEFKNNIFSKFMVQNNLTSFKFLDSITKSRSPYISIVNAFMNMGTTNDTFYRNNSDIFNNIKEWAKYFDISNLGMIHCKNNNPYEVLKNYLPSEVSNKEGGSLQALGLININSRNDSDNELFLYFLESSDSLNEELAFGSCIGLGLVNLGTNNKIILDKLNILSKKDKTLYSESAVLGMGLVGCGTSDIGLIEKLKMLQLDTDFERVKRNIGISYSLIMTFSKYKNIKFIEDCLEFDKFGGVLSLGTSFVGTGNLDIISRILVYLNDGDDDVKRSAVISLGLVCCLDLDLLFNTLEPLSENHNYFIRSTVGLVLGFFYSGTGNEKVCDILEGLMYDTNPLVKQSAFIGIGFVIMQCNYNIVKNYKRIINKINKVIVDRSEEVSVKYGAMVGRGISESGGRNIIFSITNLCNKISKERVVGCIMFLNHWYWYPFLNFISLNMKETAFFVFNENLELENTRMKYEGNYDNILIKVPDIKRSRRFKSKPIIEEEIITKASEYVYPGERCTRLQMSECGIDFPGVFFIRRDD